MSGRFIFTQASLSGLWIIERKAIGDNRGFFSRLFCVDEFRRIGLDKPIVQINHSFSHKKGTVRGLHFQFPPHAETKIVSCKRGAVYDVAVDIRSNSKTFLHWYGITLSADNRLSLFIPEGFAHGFQTLTDESEVIYFTTKKYFPESEGVLDIADPNIGVSWPLEITEISRKDRYSTLSAASFLGVVL